ncbi:hypothetical protein SDC9_152832 [bioreactor metagenome]|uniref:Uncharacterized protein n=1 Tax=bioreactor metagenome TaxID=1076179 RepID=A0A645EU78_9ZZZZ
MSAGEGITRRLRAGGFYNGKLGIQHPRAGNDEEQLEKRVDQIAKETHIQQKIAAFFIQTPENCHGDNHEERLFAKKCKKLEDGV